LRMRLACCASILLKSRSADSDSSTRHATTLQDVFQRDGLLFVASDAVENALGQVEVFQILQMFEDGFASVESLSPPRAPGELFKALFDGWWKADGQH